MFEGNVHIFHQLLEYLQANIDFRGHNMFFGHCGIDNYVYYFTGTTRKLPGNEFNRSLTKGFLLMYNDYQDPLHLISELKTDVWIQTISDYKVKYDLNVEKLNNGKLSILTTLSCADRVFTSIFAGTKTIVTGAKSKVKQLFTEVYQTIPEDLIEKIALMLITQNSPKSWLVVSQPLQLLKKSIKLQELELAKVDLFMNNVEAPLSSMKIRKILTSKVDVGEIKQSLQDVYKEISEMDLSESIPTLTNRYKSTIDEIELAYKMSKSYSLS